MRRLRKTREHFGVLVFFFSAHLQIFRLCSTLKPPNERTVQYMEKNIEQNGSTYEPRGEQYFPLLEIPEQKEIGRWGLLHLGYLKLFAIARYNELLISGELNTYLYKINEEAQGRYESLLVDFVESHGLTEELKAKDQMKWIQLANCVANAAKGIVESEVIFRCEPFSKNCFTETSAQIPIAEATTRKQSSRWIHS